MKTDSAAMTELVKQRFGLWRDVIRAGDFVRGSVVVLRRPCTYGNCRLCREGKRHPATYLSMKEKGRTRLIYLPKRLIPQVKGWVAQWRRLENLLHQMSQTNAQILRLLARRKERRGS
jgi:hypothetical protein